MILYTRGMWKLFLFSMLTVAGCSSITSSPEPPAENPQAVGRIISIEDQTPVDGGVKIELMTVENKKLTFFMRSLFRNPPPSEVELELYRTIQKLNVDDWVRGYGEFDDGTLILTGIALGK